MKGTPRPLPKDQAEQLAPPQADDAPAQPTTGPRNPLMSNGDRAEPQEQPGDLGWQNVRDRAEQQGRAQPITLSPTIKGAVARSVSFPVKPHITQTLTSNIPMQGCTTGGRAEQLDAKVTGGAHGHRIAGQDQTEQPPSRAEQTTD